MPKFPFFDVWGILSKQCYDENGQLYLNRSFERGAQRLHYFPRCIALRIM